ncbi:hypothetical protein [Streptomyces sp. Inha503]|uniref:hypothetical protein n=1 Tax=Streptomyces sp. Inha503 TaxID=3383314 RepID=UPI0039A0582B
MTIDLADIYDGFPYQLGRLGGLALASGQGDRRGQGAAGRHQRQRLGTLEWVHRTGINVLDRGNGNLHHAAVRSGFVKPGA